MFARSSASKKPLSRHAAKSARVFRSAAQHSVTPSNLVWTPANIPVVGPGDEGYLQVGSANDPLEQEADHVAEQVMSKSASAGSTSGAGPSVRRASASGYHSAPLMASPVVREVLRSPGQPLDEATRTYFEPRFRHDLSAVRCTPTRGPVLRLKAYRRARARSDRILRSLQASFSRGRSGDGASLLMSSRTSSNRITNPA